MPLTPFSKRHEQAIYDKRVKPSLPVRCRRRLAWQIERAASGTDDWNHDWTLLPDLCDRLLGLYGETTLKALDENNKVRYVNNIPDFVYGAYPARVFDVIELLHEMLPPDHAHRLTAGINTVLEEERIPWALVAGQMLKVDEDFLNLRLSNRTVGALETAGFQGAIAEFQEARNDLSAGQTKDAIHAASKSFESTMKCLLGRTDGSAAALIGGLSEGGFFDDLPENMRKSFGDQVLTALPYLRNRLGGHGQGAEVHEVPEEYADLALNLAGAFITFLVRHRQKAIGAPEPSGSDDAPF